MRKSFSLLIAGTIFIQSMPVLAAPNDIQTSEVFNQTIEDTLQYAVENNEVTILDYTGTETEVVIPSEINGYPVTKIGNSAFYHKGITHISIPETVTEIGANALWGNNLQEVELPKSIKMINEYAFGDNSISEITIPYNVEYVSDRAFAEIQNLQTIYVENKYDSILGAPWGANAQVVWNALIAEVEVAVEPFQTVYEEGEHFQPTGLVITLRKDGEVVREVEYVGNASDFEFSPSLDRALTKEDTVIRGIYKGLASDVVFEQAIKVKEKSPFQIMIENNTATIVGYTGVETEVVIPSEINGYPVTKIGNSAFYHKGITHISIPETVTEIGANALWGNNLQEVELPKSIKMIHEYAFGDNSISEITIPYNVEYVSDRAFAEIQNLQTIYVENKYDSILGAPWGANAQVVWNALIAEVEVAVEPFQTVYEEGEYFQPTGLVITLRKDGEVVREVEYVGNASDFEFSPSLDRALTKEDTVIRGIYKGLASDVVFEQAIKVKEKSPFQVMIENNTATIVGYTGMETDLVIPSQINGYRVTKIGNSAFYNEGITSISIPETVTEIGANALWGNNLREVELPKSIKMIHEYAFGDNSISEIAIPYNVEYVSDRAFAEMHHLQAIYVENKYDSILGAPWGSNAQVIWNVLTEDSYAK